MIQSKHKVTYITGSNKYYLLQNKKVNFVPFDNTTRLMFNKFFKSPSDDTYRDLRKRYWLNNKIYNRLVPFLSLFIKNNKVDFIIYDHMMMSGKALAKKEAIPSICSSPCLIAKREDIPTYDLDINIEDLPGLSYKEFIECYFCESPQKIFVYISKEFANNFNFSKTIFFGNRKKYLKSSVKHKDSKIIIYISFGMLYNQNLSLITILIKYFENNSY